MKTIKISDQKLKSLISASNYLIEHPDILSLLNKKYQLGRYEIYRKNN